jgi:hypothetical protein
MTPNADPSTLTSVLRQALREKGHAAADAPMELLPDKGLAHDHVRLAGTGLLARVPKQSQMDLGAVDNLLYQRACFERASASGHTPRLHGWLPPTSALPRGALLVEEIAGRPARLPQDLQAMARAMAAWHRLPLPLQAQRAPLLNPPDPLQALALEIEAQASHLTAAGMAPDVLRLIDAERARLRQCCDHGERPARSLIAFDGHPGNFLIRDDGSAVLVDLEKCRYGYPGLDLAHATLYTSTTWDVATHAVLTEGEVLAFYQGWGSEVGEGAGDAMRWHLPLRRAMWLWSITWCAKWRVLSRRERKPGADGEDWSAERSEAALVTHVRERVDHYLGLPVVQRVLEGFGTFERGLRS